MPFPPLVLVAHRRAPVQRVLRTNLEAEPLFVTTVATATDCLAALRVSQVSALVVDVDLLRETVPDGLLLRSYLVDTGLPSLLLSWNPCDRELARQLGGLSFTTRLDDIERLTDMVRALLTPAAATQPC